MEGEKDEEGRRGMREVDEVKMKQRSPVRPRQMQAVISISKIKSKTNGRPRRKKAKLRLKGRPYVASVAGLKEEKSKRWTRDAGRQMME